MTKILHTNRIDVLQEVEVEIAQKTEGNKTENDKADSSTVYTNQCKFGKYCSKQSTCNFNHTCKYQDKFKFKQRCKYAHKDLIKPEQKMSKSGKESTDKGNCKVNHNEHSGIKNLKEK